MIPEIYTFLHGMQIGCAVAILIALLTQAYTLVVIWAIIIIIAGIIRFVYDTRGVSEEK